MTERFLMDSNSFIVAAQRAYQFDCFPSFWNWLRVEIQKLESKVIVPFCVFNELKDHNDDLSVWIKDYIKAFSFDERRNPVVWENYAKVMNYINTANVYVGSGASNWSSVGKADPILVAIAMTFNHRIVTFEQRSGAFQKINNNGKSSNKPKNPNYRTSKEPKIPDVADYFGVGCVDFYTVERDLKLKL